MYEVTLSASDGGGLTTELDVTVTVTNVDEPPDLTGEAHVEIVENSTDFVGRYRASDPEGEQVVWLPLSGADSSHFEFTDAGLLSFTAVPDHDVPGDADEDNVYEVTLGATDGSRTRTLGVSVTITGVDEPPEITGEPTIEVEEQDRGPVAAYTATDPKAARPSGSRSQARTATTSPSTTVCSLSLRHLTSRTPPTSTATTSTR